MVIKCGRLGIYARTTDDKHISQLGNARPRKHRKDWADRELFDPSFKVNKVVSVL